MLSKVDGIVLRSQNYGETHKIITIFTETLGIISAISRGANKGKSRLTAISQPFIHGQFLLYVSKGLSTVQQGEMIHSFRSIREDIVKTAYVAYLCEFTNRTIEQRTPNRLLYEELLDTFKWIDLHDDYMIPIFMYELKLFQVGGYAPILQTCVNCNRVDELHYFSIKEGGALCHSCSDIDERAVLLHEKLIHILAVLQRTRLRQIGQVSMKETNVMKIRQLLDQYYDAYGGYTLKSKRFLAQIDKLI